MAQSGYTPIQLYYSSTTTNVPLAANLAYGELAINITDGKLFYKDNANAVQVIGWKTVPISAGGTGQTTQQAAINALAGAVTSTYYLRGNGTNVAMSAIQALDVPTLNQDTTGSSGSVKSNANTGLMQITGPAAGSTRVMTIPNANFTVARTDAGQTFTGTQAFGAISASNAAIGSGATTLGLVEIQQSATTAALWVQTGGTSVSYIIADFRNGSNVPVLQALGNNTVFVNSLGTGLVYSNSGTLTSTNPSDARLKTDVKDLSWGLADVLALRPVSYKWQSDKIEQGTQYGFIAQEVQSVMPELVREFDTEDGTRYGLEKEGIYAAMVKSIQELNTTINALTARITALESK